MSQTLNMGIRHRLERQHGLNAERLEGIAQLADRLFIRHSAVAALLHHHVAGHREKAGVGIERQEEVDDRQNDGDILSTFHG